ncbi:DUF1565 domain-containing protein, partial [Candidatus Parcubacteria bacterium]
MFRKRLGDYPTAALTVVSRTPGIVILFVLLAALPAAAASNLMISGPAPQNRANKIAVTGSTYYVSTSGSDTNPGTLAQPFRTIQRGINAAQPGDTIVVKKGTYGPGLARATYGHAEFNPNTGNGRSGTVGAGITLRAENPATEVPESERTILVGDGSGFGLYLNGVSFITIEGFE